MLVYVVMIGVHRQKTIDVKVFLKICSTCLCADRRGGHVVEHDFSKKYEGGTKGTEEASVLEVAKYINQGGCCFYVLFSRR